MTASSLVSLKRTIYVFMPRETRDGELVMGYGAADEMVGIVRTDWAELIRHIRSFDAEGNRTA